MNSSNNDYSINNTIEYMYKYILPVIYILGNIGNLLSLLIFWKKSWKKNVCVFYFNVFLLFNSCYINSTILATIFMDGFQINLENLNVILCKLYLYISFVFITLSPTILTFASIDRLLISSQNVNTRLYSSKRLAYFSVSVGTLFWIVLNSHILIESNIDKESDSNFVCSFQSSTFYSNFITFFFGMIYVGFCLLLFVLCMFAWKNVRRIRALPRQKRIRQIRTMTKKDFQLLRCLFMQDIVYIFFSLLFIIFCVYEAMTKNLVRISWQTAVLNFVEKFIFILYNIYFSSNFLVFIILSKAFRYELKRIIHSIIGKNLYPMRKEENRLNNIGRDNVELNVVVVVSTIELPA